MTALHNELHALEQGCEPNHERIQRALFELADRPPGPHAEDIRDLCARLGTYMRELRQDDMEFSLEDLDVLLESWSRLDALAGGQTLLAPRPVQKNTRVPELDRVFGGPGGAPEFWQSGLQVESHGPHLRLVVPEMEDSRATALVLCDLQELWSVTPPHLGWQVDLLSLERVPVSLLSLLVHLDRSRATGARRIELAGGVDTVQSHQLQECLARCFELHPQAPDSLSA